eukprot:scaffold701_cov58-Cylindrotheca_fusiformis.AAC.1
MYRTVDEDLFWSGIKGLRPNAMPWPNGFDTSVRRSCFLGNDDVANVEVRISPMTSQKQMYYDSRSADRTRHSSFVLFADLGARLSN